MSALHDFTTRVLLRYFRAGRSASLSDPKLDRIKDLDLLRWHWAVSNPVMELCQHILHNRHEVQSSLSERLRVDDAIVRGRMDARRTIMARIISGHPTRVVFAEPVRNYTSGPNHVLVWVLQRAHFLLRQFTKETEPGRGYTDKIAQTMQVLSSARRINTVAQAIAETDYTQYPSPQSLTQAAMARRRLYRLAYGAIRLLRQVEDGDPAAITGMLRDTLIAPLHEWQVFELALALGMGTALAEASGGPLRLRNIVPGASSAIVEAGAYILHWQTTTSAYSLPPAEPSEERVEAILTAYGISSGDDRPDIVVSHGSTGIVAAIGEAKYFTNETDGWRAAFREAAAQLVRYGRGYASGAALDQLLARSMMGLWSYPAIRPSALPAGVPMVFDFNDLQEGRMQWWATCMLASMAAATQPPEVESLALAPALPLS